MNPNEFREEVWALFAKLRGLTSGDRDEIEQCFVELGIDIDAIIVAMTLADTEKANALLNKAQARVWASYRELL